MTCVHLRKLYELCQTYDLKLGGADLIHIICHECGEKEVCPSGLMDELPDEGNQGENAPGKTQPQK
jgi:hypothetical protein